MHSRASQALSKAFQKRGEAARLSQRSGISQSRLSKLASGATETAPSLEVCLALKSDPELPIDPAWWLESPLDESDADKGAA